MSFSVNQWVTRFFGSLLILFFVATQASAQSAITYQDILDEEAELTRHYGDFASTQMTNNNLQNGPDPVVTALLIDAVDKAGEATNNLGDAYYYWTALQQAIADNDATGVSNAMLNAGLKLSLATANRAAADADLYAAWIILTAP
mgnify:CR=1 FL=1